MTTEDVDTRVHIRKISPENFIGPLHGNLTSPFFRPFTEKDIFETKMYVRVSVVSVPTVCPVCPSPAGRDETTQYLLVQVKVVGIIRLLKSLRVVS